MQTLFYIITLPSSFNSLLMPSRFFRLCSSLRLCFRRFSLPSPLFSFPLFHWCPVFSFPRSPTWLALALFLRTNHRPQRFCVTKLSHLPGFLLGLLDPWTFYRLALPKRRWTTTNVRWITTQNCQSTPMRSTELWTSVADGGPKDISYWSPRFYSGNEVREWNKVVSWSGSSFPFLSLSLSLSLSLCFECVCIPCLFRSTFIFSQSLLSYRVRPSHLCDCVCVCVCVCVCGQVIGMSKQELSDRERTA